jgi:hypothetical protein
MGLKFRRGTNAQKSGSLAFGEPYVNTDLGTLQIGGLTGDITLGASGTGSQGSFAGISGSSLDITGNANIAGNVTIGGQLQIGDQTTDTLNVVASLSSSLIPSITNTFDLGSAAKFWRDLYISTGSIKFIGTGGAIVGTLSNTGNGMALDGGIVANGNSTFGTSSLAVTSVTGSLRVSGSLDVIGGITGSIAATNGVVSGSSQVVGILSGLNTFSASENSKSATLALYTASVDTKFTTIQTLTASLATTGSNTFVGDQTITGSLAINDSATNFLIEGNPFGQTYLTAGGAIVLNPGYGGVEMVGSYRTFKATDITAEGFVSGEIRANNGVVSGSSQVVGILSSLNSFSASENTKSSTLALYTASVDTKFSTLQTLTASMAAQVSRLQESTASLNAFTNSFNSAIQLTGSNVNIAGNLTIAGTTTTVNSTNVAIADSVIELNYGGAVIRGGILVKDGTGGSNVSGSLLWDGTNDQWIAGVSGSESKILRAGSDSVISGSSQVLGILDSVNAFSASENTKSETLRLYTASVDTKFSTLATYTASNDTTNTTQNSRLTTLESVTGSYETKGRGIVSGSSQIVGSSITTNTITIGSTSTALGGTSTTLAGLTSVSSTGFTGALTGNASTATTLATARTINGTSFNGSADITIANLVSGSSQIAIASVSGYDANRWVDHTGVSISAGNGLSGGGTIAATRTLSLDTTSATFTTGVTTQNNALGVVSGSRTISGITLGSNLGTLTISTGLSGTSYNGSTGVTIANTGVLSITSNTGLSSNVSATGNVTITNTGVTSNVAGTGISVSGATGAVTITNSGVTSIVAGTGVSRDSATGAVTISIGQAVATSSNVQFNSLGIGMAASATAGRIDATNDIVAYSSSDIRFKENIKPIENALQKISKISGNTYDWKTENKIEHGYEGNDVGVIAQEIEEVLPQLVQTRENGYKAVKYDKLVALLIEGIKEQQTQIHSLTIEIEKLKESKGL